MDFANNKAGHHPLSSRINSAFDGVPVGESMLGDNSFFGLTPNGTPLNEGANSSNNKENNLGISRVDDNKLNNNFIDEEEDDLSDLI